jgi:cell division protease FtsH
VNNKRWRNAGLYLPPMIVTIALATTFLAEPAQSQARIKYSQFIQQLKQGNVENVGLSRDRTKALVHYNDGTRKTVYLPPSDPQLIDILTTNVKGNIYVLPPNEDSPEKSWIDCIKKWWKSNEI